ncbi:hypothetical protein CY34DRAFT_813993 [Suillus luteus UH-Slu-Lm8-n1]|uniref:Uncharacterized protein n=1 Tax=Suillus luteus UH-Slu-Lm8-n1 TaxID=930992 RepID=A0A0D0A3Z5_9AGAM|nr:hypothetical protein CY34DRAFT_813993 [Suillus luteus UH-Slu-Lm8-n1]
MPTSFICHRYCNPTTSQAFIPTLRVSGQIFSMSRAPRQNNVKTQQFAAESTLIVLS